MNLNRHLPSQLQVHAARLKTYFGRLEFDKEIVFRSNGFDITKSLRNPNPKDVTIFLMHCLWGQMHEAIGRSATSGLPKWSEKFLPNYSDEQFCLLDKSVLRAEEWVSSVRPEYLVKVYGRGGFTPTERAILEKLGEEYFLSAYCILGCWAKINWLLGSLSLPFDGKLPIKLVHEREMISRMCSRRGFKEGISRLDFFALGHRMPGAGFSKQ